MTEEEIEKLWGSIADADKRRAKNLPTEQHCLRAMMDAYVRLKELGWNDIMYAPKDGQVVESISVGSTGIHPANYDGEWPKGRWWVHDGGDLWPGTPAMYRKTEAEIARWKQLGEKFREEAAQAMSAGTAETRGGSGLQPTSAVRQDAPESHPHE